MWKPIIGTALLAAFLAAPVLAVGLDDVIQMLDAGVGEEVILKVIDADNEHFVITSEDLIDLKQAGASDWFLKEILDRSEQSDRNWEDSYHSIEPYYPSYGSMRLIYDPFDYYFVYWPYYYSYVSPFRFCWNWWYYGGPVHRSWCNSWGHRVTYYDRCWGTRTVWNRGYRDARYHVPRYEAAAEHRALYNRPVHSETVRPDGARSRSWERQPTTDRPRHVTVRERGTSREAPSRSPVWGRTGGREANPPARPERRPEVRSQTPPSRAPAPSRPSAPSRGSAPPSAPSRPPRQVYSR